MSISIVGERRIGKTSLLKILQVESLGKGIYAEGSTLDAQETYYSSAEVSRHSFVILSFAPNLSSGGLRFARGNDKFEKPKTDRLFLPCCSTVFTLT